MGDRGQLMAIAPLLIDPLLIDSLRAIPPPNCGVPVLNWEKPR